MHLGRSGILLFCKSREVTGVVFFYHTNENIFMFNETIKSL
jgi:hypothetical protein